MQVTVPYSREIPEVLHPLKYFEYYTEFSCMHVTKYFNSCVVVN